MRRMILLLTVLALVGGCAHPVLDCYFTPVQAKDGVHYQGPCKPAPEGKYP